MHRVASKTARVAAQESAAEGDRFSEISERVARLEAVLAASGGTLHDVNNLLTVLSGNLYLLTEAVRKEPDLLERCRSARNTVQRAAALIQELLSFARGSAETASVICPARHLRSMVPLLQRGLGTGHRIVLKSGDDPWHVAASAAQLESAVANLVLNSKEAMTSPGSIVISVENFTEEHNRKSEDCSRAEDYVRIVVTDNGPGIPETLIPKVTQPLFTSKASGKGNGMGLAMVRSFAERAGGSLRIESVLGKGTRISILLPRRLQDVDVTANLTMPIATLPTGEESVLLFATDPEARATINQLLDALGYSVFQCRDRQHGLRVARECSELSLVICERSDEQQQPEQEWLNELIRIKPGIRHLAILGPEANAATAAPDAHACVRHPIGVPNLASTIRSALEEKE